MAIESLLKPRLPMESYRKHLARALLVAKHLGMRLMGARLEMKNLRNPGTAYSLAHNYSPGGIGWRAECMGPRRNSGHFPHEVRDHLLWTRFGNCIR
jgi:hypothetical protein